MRDQAEVSVAVANALVHLIRMAVIDFDGCFRKSLFKVRQQNRDFEQSNRVNRRDTYSTDDTLSKLTDRVFQLFEVVEEALAAIEIPFASLREFKRPFGTIDQREPKVLFKLMNRMTDRGLRQATKFCCLRKTTQGSDVAEHFGITQQHTRLITSVDITVARVFAP